MTFPTPTFWQSIILFASGFLTGGVLSGLIFEAHGWHRRGKYAAQRERERKIMEEINRKNEEGLSKRFSSR